MLNIIKKYFHFYNSFLVFTLIKKYMKQIKAMFLLCQIISFFIYYFLDMSRLYALMHVKCVTLIINQACTLAEFNSDSHQQPFVL